MCQCLRMSSGYIFVAGHLISYLYRLCHPSSLISKLATHRYILSTSTSVLTCHSMLVFPLQLRTPRLTIFGRSLILISAEFLANAACWIVAGLLFARRTQTKDLMSLCLLAWVGFWALSLSLHGLSDTYLLITQTIGLRHGKLCSAI